MFKVIITFGLLGYTFPLMAQSSYTKYQDNGTIRIGRDSVAGGSIVWVSKTGGLNFVNNMDYGRQIQMNVRDKNGDYNPTQAGDGVNPSGSLIVFADSNYTFSKTTPLLFYNLPPYIGPPLPASNQRFYMWTEFLPNSNSRAFLVKTYYENWDSQPGECYNQYVSPLDYVNYDPFTRLKVYDGKYPWTGGALSNITDPTGNFISTPYSMTENWQALVDNNDYGLAHLGDLSFGDLLFYDFPSPNGTKVAGGQERFAMRVDPGDTMQRREGWGIYYIGNVAAARTFFTGYKPVKAGSFSDNFSDINLPNWYRNNNPIQVIGGAVKMGPDTSWVNDMSLINKYWGDAIYSVDVKNDVGTSWYGMAIRKTGRGHFWDAGSGYYLIYLAPGGQLILFSPTGGILANAIIPGFNASAWNNLKIDMFGYSFNIKVNNISYITYTDPNQSFLEGYVSLVSDQNTVSFDNFNVTATGDSIAPSQVTGASMSLSSSNKNSLTWINPNESDWRWTRIVRKENGLSTHWRDGIPVYEGKLNYYHDLDIDPNKTYCYTIYTCDHAGNYSSGIDLCPTTSMSEGANSDLHLQCFPNPFNEKIEIQFTLSIPADVVLQIYNPLGQLILKRENRRMEKGVQRIIIDGATLADGIYYCHLITNQDSVTIKLIHHK